MQSRLESFVESCVSTAIGFGIALFTWQFIAAPIFGYHPTLEENLGITSIFTVVSILRQYVIRRFFEGNVYRFTKRRAVAMIDGFAKHAGTPPAEREPLDDEEDE